MLKLFLVCKYSLPDLWFNPLFLPPSLSRRSKVSGTLSLKLLYYNDPPVQHVSRSNILGQYYISSSTACQQVQHTVQHVNRSNIQYSMSAGPTYLVSTTYPPVQHVNRSNIQYSMSAGPTYLVSTTYPPVQHVNRSNIQYSMSAGPTHLVSTTHCVLYALYPGP